MATVTRTTSAALCSFWASRATHLQRGAHDYRDPRYACSALRILMENRDMSVCNDIAMTTVTRAMSAAVCPFWVKTATRLQ